MSETIQETVAVDEDEQLDLADDSVSEKTDKTWQRDELTPLVQANANVLVRCPWMGNAVVTLSEAMNSYSGYPVPFLEEYQDMVIAVVIELLSTPVVEAEEQAQEEKPDEAAEEKSQADKTEKERAEPNNESNSPEVRKQAEQETPRTTEHITSEVPANQSLEALGSKIAIVTADSAEGAVSPSRSQPKRPSQKTKTEATNSEKASRMHTSSLRPAAGRPITIKEPEASGHQAVSEDSGQKLPKERLENRVAKTKHFQAEESPPPLVIELPKPVVDVPVELYNPKDVIVEESEAVILPEAEAAIQLEALRLPAVLPEDLVTPKEAEKTIDQITEIENEPDLTLLNYETTAEGTFYSRQEDLPEFFEENTFSFDEIDISDAAELTAEDGMDTEPLVNVLAEEAKLSELDDASVEQPTTISATIEKIEDSLTQLAEKLEVTEPEETKRLNEILDEIIEVPAKLEEEEIITIEAETELEELFVELFEKANVAYTPEIIESLARLTLQWHLTEGIEKLKSEKQAEKPSAGGGTHEIIKKLLKGLSLIKKAIAQASALGKSALRLYSFSPAT